ncbi:MAG: DNA primase catalytic subunit PriS [Hadesarchaea archaeon]|nr:MAG: DNA primase catalytic subunit PriS [Hadesarchaea archaeon]
MQFRKATPEERKRFYQEEWNKHEIPDFIQQTLSLREFGFDPDGSGPNQRYRQFFTLEQLSSYLKSNFPFSVYVSVALYEQPSRRAGWIKSELAFDVDAKDLPVKPCSCGQGEVCECCLEEARRVVMLLSDVLSSDLGLRDLRFSYSGRGFHLRVLDEAVSKLEQNERAQLVSYVTGSVIPTDLSFVLGYSKVFREFAARTLERLSEEKLKEVFPKLAQRIQEKKREVLEALRRGRREEIKRLVGKEEKLLEFLAKLNAGWVDGRVTVDVKRILRLPSTLHSGVSMKCVPIRDIENFSLDQAIPKFILEG